MTANKDLEPKSKPEYEIDPPDGGYGWVILACVSYFFFTAQGAIAITGLFIVEFEENFQVSKTYVSFIGAAAIGPVVFFAPVIALAIKKFGNKAVTIVAIFMCETACVITFLAPRVEVLFGTFFILGIGASAFYIAADIILQQYFHKKRSLANGIAVTASAAAVGVWPPLTRALIDHYGWRGAILLVGAIDFHALPVAMLLRPVPRKEIKQQNTEGEKVDVFIISKPDGQNNVTDTNNSLEKKELTSPAKETSRCRLIIASLITFTSWVGIRSGDTVMLTHSPIRATMMDITKIEVAILLAIQGISQTIMCIPWGMLGDRKWMSETSLVSLGSILCGASMCVSLLYKTFDLMIINSVLFGIGAAALNTLGSSSVIEILGIARVEQGIALLFSSYGLANISAPPIAGFMYDEFGVFWTVLTFGLYQLVGGALLLPAIYFKQNLS